MQRHEMELFADYHQFYLQDETADADVSFESWTDEAIENGAVIMPGKIFVQTARNMDVPVIIETHEMAPDDDMSEWDKVFECSADFPSGKVVIAGCTDPWDAAFRLQITPGSYRVRIYSGGLDSLSEDGMDGSDHYKVVLWRAPITQPARLK